MNHQEQTNWGLQGIPIFLMFDPKHRLWVLVRTASPVLTCTHNQCFEQTYKNYQIFSMKFSIFNAEKIFCILHGQISVMSKQ